MDRVRYFLAIVSGCFCALVPARALAWGSLGHRIVAEAAAMLVRDEQPQALGDLLARHRFELGVYAFRPDSQFRHHDGKGGAAEGPLHFLSLDALTGISLDAPLAQVEPKLTPKEAHAPVGRVPWRIDQLQRLIEATWKRIPAVFGAYQRGGTAEEPQRSVFQALYLMGVLAHYTGDITVPHHAVEDANSFHVNQGGLHFYFEGDCVEVFEPDLGPAVLKLARAQQKTWRKEHQGTPVQIALSVLASSMRTLPALERADKDNVLLSPSQGKSLAKRKPPSEGCRALRPIVEERLALAAAVTAELWRRAVPSSVDWQRESTLQFNDLYDKDDVIAFP
jgi:hypothetical protein